MGRLISATVLAKRNNVEKKEVFALLESAGLVERVEGKIVLTPEGAKLGGDYIESKDYGRYVGWPEGLDLAALAKRPPSHAPTVSEETEGAADSFHSDKLLTATVIGKHFAVSANKCNYVLSELGWLKKGLKGWLVTTPGERLGGVQSEDYRSGVPYARWPASILENKALVDTMGEVNGAVAVCPPEEKAKSSSEDFREKFPATHRAADGHMVRSRAEMLIDNWLYMAEIVHAYERKLPIEEDVYCDFYIPTGKVYIEFWGLENDPKYQARKTQKKSIYEKYGFNLIELGDSDVQNLDDILPRHLLRFGVQAY